MKIIDEQKKKNKHCCIVQDSCANKRILMKAKK